MAYGGGVFMTQNKTMPGRYIVFVSRKRATATISDRGVAAAPFELSWGEPGVVREITQGDFLKNCWDLFGYSYSDAKMLCLREIFQHAIKVFCYRLPATGATKAFNVYAVAKYVGERGNDIKIKIEKLDKENNDDPQPYLVTTLVGAKVVDEQTVTSWYALKDNDWVNWTKLVTADEAIEGTFVKTTDTELDSGATYNTFVITSDSSLDSEKTYYTQSGSNKYVAVKAADLDVSDIGTYYEKTTIDEPLVANIGSYFVQTTESVTRRYKFTAEAEEAGVKYAVTTRDQVAATALSGGDDGTIDVEAHSDFLDEIEPLSFNTLCCPVAGKNEEGISTINLYVNKTKYMRDQVGAKFQLVAYKPAADYEGVIGLWNSCSHPSIDVDEAALTYWLTGAEAAAPINGSLTNSKYDGELTIPVDVRQLDLEKHIEAGHLVFHKSNGNIVVLTDINTFVSLREDFGDIFQKNQIIRYIDNVANDLGALFVKRYLGTVQNDDVGRDGWKNDCIKYFRESQRLRAITDFDPEIISVEPGDTKDSVETIINGLNVVCAMEKLYMTVVCV